MTALTAVSVDMRDGFSKHLRGLALEWTRLQVWARLIQLLLTRSTSPAGAWRTLRRLTAERDRARPRRVRRYAVAQGRAFFALYAPGFPSRAFDRFAHNEITRAESLQASPPVQTAIFAITTRCGLRCEHCFEWNALGSREALSAEALHGIAEQIVSSGTSQLFLSGGEPLLRFGDLLGLVQRFSDRADIWALTAGSGLTAARARSLREAGLTGIGLSLDHWNPERHDAFRGKAGTFSSARSAARVAREADLLVALSLCPTRSFATEENLRAYREVAREWGASFIQVLEPRAVGRYAGEDVDLSDDQRRLLERWYEEANALEATGPSIAYVALSERRMGCPGAGDQLMYVDTRGTLHACPFCREGEKCLTATPLAEALQAVRARGCGRPRAATAR